MNNGFRWLSDNEIEIFRDNDIVREEIDSNIDVSKILLYQNIIEILDDRMLDLTRNMMNYAHASFLNNLGAILNLFIMLVMILAGFIFDDSMSIISTIFKISGGLLIYLWTQSLINNYQLKKIQREYKVTEQLKKTYVKGLEESKNMEKGLPNSFYKSTNVISFSEYNSMFYELVDRQVNNALEKNKVKKLTLKKKDNV